MRVAKPLGSGLGLMAAVLAWAGLGCASESVDDPASPAAVAASDAIAKTSELGPVKAVIRVWPAKPVLGEPIYARLEIEAPAGVAVTAPFQSTGEQLGRFRVVGFTNDSAAATGKQLQTYTLEAHTSGKHRVPPLRLEVLDGRGGDKPTAPQELLTEEVPLEVAPVPAQTASAALRPGMGELDPDVGGISWLTVLGIVSVVAVVGAGGGLLISQRRQRQRIVAQRSAYDEAIARLHQLAARGAPAAGDADGWFVDLSAIVRRYLELRYEIRAPELTTEEFLQVAIARRELATNHRALLAQFLDRCDRVKFAGYRPAAAESLESLAAARAFVEETKLTGEPASPATAQAAA